MEATHTDVTKSAGNAVSRHVERFTSFRLFKRNFERYSFVRGFVHNGNFFS